EDAEYTHRSAQWPKRHGERMHDYIFLTENDPHEADDVFDQLRWGGQVVYASRSRRMMQGLAERYAQRGFAVVREGTAVRRQWLNVRIAFLPALFYVFIARKVLLVRPREITDRFTYDVRLDFDKSTKE